MRKKLSKCKMFCFLERRRQKAQIERKKKSSSEDSTRKGVLKGNMPEGMGRGVPDPGREVSHRETGERWEMWRRFGGGGELQEAQSRWP